MNSVTTSPRRYITAAREWLHRDYAGPVSLAITSPRASLAHAVSDLGNAIARLGSRIHRDAAGDYWQGQRDAWELARVWQWHTRRAARGDVVRMLDRLGFDSSEETLERLTPGL